MHENIIYSSNTGNTRLLAQTIDKAPRRVYSRVK